MPQPRTRRIRNVALLQALRLVSLLAAVSLTERALARLPELILLRPGDTTNLLAAFVVAAGSKVTVDPSYKLPGIDVVTIGEPSSGDANVKITVELTAQSNIPPTNYTIPFFTNGKPSPLTIRVRVVNPPPRIIQKNNVVVLTPDGQPNSLTFEVEADAHAQLVGTCRLDKAARDDGITFKSEDLGRNPRKFIFTATSTNAAGKSYTNRIAFTDGIHPTVIDVVVIQVKPLAPLAPANLSKTIRIGGVDFIFKWIKNLPGGEPFPSDHPNPESGGWVLEDVLTRGQLNAVMEAFKPNANELKRFHRLFALSNANRDDPQKPITGIDWFMANQVCEVLMKVAPPPPNGWAFCLPELDQMKFVAGNNKVFGLKNLVDLYWQWTRTPDKDDTNVYYMFGRYSRIHGGRFNGGGYPGDEGNRGSIGELPEEDYPAIRPLLLPTKK